MLKNLLQTWIEAVFTSKKSYIASQCLPNGICVYQTFTEQEKSLVVPFDGWVRVQAQCNALQAHSQECLITINKPDNTWPSIVLPVRKGATLSCTVLEGENNGLSVWFVHNLTGE